MPPLRVFAPPSVRLPAPVLVTPPLPANSELRLQVELELLNSRLALLVIGLVKAVASCKRSVPPLTVVTPLYVIPAPVKVCVPLPVFTRLTILPVPLAIAPEKVALLPVLPSETVVLPPLV